MEPKARALTTLHDIVVDYVINNAYAGTARVLAATPAPAGQPSSSTPQEAVSAPAPDELNLMEQLAAARADKRRSEAMDVDDDDDGDDGEEDEAPAPLSEDVLDRVEKRRVLSGAIGRAVDALHAHFPSVLSPTTSHGSSSNGAGGARGGSSNGSNGAYVVTPRASRTPAGSGTPRGSGGDNHATPVFARSTEADHVRLNLQIQQFIESFRQIVPSAPSSPTSSIGSLNGSTGGGGSLALNVALTALQGLHADALRMPSAPRAVYLQEIKDVGGLLAYTDPENSTLGGFLDQARRIALAQQVNAAILRSEGRATQSYLEQIARRTSAIYETISDKDIDPQPTWTGSDAKGASAAHWRIAEQLKRRPFQKGGFNLHEYVWEMA